jgi:hypothetical protein
MPSSRTALDNTSPARMFASMVGYVVGLAGMALLGFGSLLFIKLLVDSVLVFIPSIITEQNPLKDLAIVITYQKVMYSICSAVVGTILRKISGYLCVTDTLDRIDAFFYREN